ncbi:hypothetical protein GWK36_02715 [Caldichromatium japonicum]|uniref:Uncharacterized protein n=1 Tax=Caldichromatium japonicum TaxID=2699430 RepID=A0A6G7VAJ4_9GAMM|nr:hypothetical protein [Caldichromatium japonicum]QIK37093.1 hypothetical protein GWK36_02715 [Caldichromatium japonicum]
MALHLKTRWKDETRDRSLGDVASALAAVAWRIALAKAINLHCERFVYRDDAQRLAVIQEYLAFLLQVADRLAFEALAEAERRALIVEFAKRLCAHVQDNGEDLLGPGDHAAAFLARLNERSDEYAEFQLTDEGPSYAFLRHLGHTIQTLMGEADENRWVIDQVMDKDGWEAYQDFRRAYRNLLG